MREPRTVAEWLAAKRAKAWHVKLKEFVKIHGPDEAVRQFGIEPETAQMLNQDGRGGRRRSLECD